MTTERYVRMFAGTFILTSLLLAYLHSRHWLWLTALVGLALLQSSLTCFCPLERILKKLCAGGLPPQQRGAGGDQGSCCQHKPDSPRSERG
ncbi:MAG: DUF2892 domain-containing protein [Verrucomicrobiia bacterium]